MARDEEPGEGAMRIFEHRDAPVANLIAQEKSIVGLAMEAMKFEFKRREAGGFLRIRYEANPLCAGGRSPGEAGGRDGKCQILVQSVRHEPEARVERKRIEVEQARDEAYGQLVAASLGDDRGEHRARDPAALRGGRGGDDADGDVGFSRMDETHPEQLAGCGIARRNGLSGIELGVDGWEKAERLVARAKARALAEAALIPLHERAVEQARGGLVIGGHERAKRAGSRHESARWAGETVGRLGAGEFAGA